MDPYLEPHWLDVHSSLIFLAKVAMQRQLNDDLVARAVAEPFVFETDSDLAHQRAIEIRDATTGGRIVTVVEFLSPFNKHPGVGCVQYKRKQAECVEAKVNLVEIDLTRTGQREMLITQLDLTPEYRTLFQACVFRASWKQFGRKRIGFRCESDFLRFRFPYAQLIATSFLTCSRWLTKRTWRLVTIAPSTIPSLRTPRLMLKTLNGRTNCLRTRGSDKCAAANPTPLAPPARSRAASPTTATQKSP